MGKQAFNRKAQRRRPTGKPCYKRVILKLSGEVLGGPSGAGLDVDFTRDLLGQAKRVADLGTRVGIVVGGGNILRGAEAVRRGLGRVSADYIGMLGTVMNGLAIRDVGGSIGLPVHVMSSLGGGSFAEPYMVEKARTYLDQGGVVVFVGGTGNPFLTTDTAAALRASEVGADAILKATKVDGVYSADPAVDRRAKRIARITFDEAVRADLRFMDRAALCICNLASIPVVVFNVYEKESIVRAVCGERIGTIVEGVSHD